MEDFRWLEQVEQSAWRNFIMVHQRLLDRLDREMRDAYGIGMPEYEILVRLSERPGHAMRMSSLADEVAMSRSRLTYVVTRMEKRGLLGRTRTAEDGRGVTCVMTEAGWSLLQDSAPLHVNGVRRDYIDQLTAEETAVVAQAFYNLNDYLCRVENVPLSAFTVNEQRADEDGN